MEGEGNILEIMKDWPLSVLPTVLPVLLPFVLTRAPSKGFAPSEPMARNCLNFIAAILPDRQAITLADLLQLIAELHVSQTPLDADYRAGLVTPAKAHASAENGAPHFSRCAKVSSGARLTGPKRPSG